MDTPKASAALTIRPESYDNAPIHLLLEADPSESRVRDYLAKSLENYDEPIFESGIQHRDMLRLGIKLQVIHGEQSWLQFLNQDFILERPR